MAASSGVETSAHFRSHAMLLQVRMGTQAVMGCTVVGLGADQPSRLPRSRPRAPAARTCSPAYIAQTCLSVTQTPFFLPNLCYTSDDARNGRNRKPEVLRLIDELGPTASRLSWHL